ncbi:MAG: hypothetical protein ACR2RD_02630 [Woeseiaceae bacterium]
MTAESTVDVLTVADAAIEELSDLLERYKLKLIIQGDGEAIQGSYWGEPEAGVIGTTIYARADTPLHSVLHESCHVICMTSERRAKLVRDAGGDDIEEAGVCYLQLVLSASLSRCGSERLMRDMDAWGYSFRLGNTKRWFLDDAEDARNFLINQNLLTAGGLPTFQLRS